jgi:hypothetical protein
MGGRLRRRTHQWGRYGVATLEKGYCGLATVIPGRREAGGRLLAAAGRGTRMPPARDSDTFHPLSNLLARPTTDELLVFAVCGKTLLLTNGRK